MPPENVWRGPGLLHCRRWRGRALRELSTCSERVFTAQRCTKSLNNSALGFLNAETAPESGSAGCACCPTHRPSFIPPPDSGASVPGTGDGPSPRSNVEAEHAEGNFLGSLEGLLNRSFQ